jgi:regulator of RNase E activity RraA
MAAVGVVERLAAFGTPTIADALEILGESPAEGFTDATLRPLSAEWAVFVGRAVTATLVTAAALEPGETRVPAEDYWRYVGRRPGPKVVVVEDLDPEPVGAMWGEVQARLHRALGVTGIVTNGAVRDLNELTRLKFPTLGSRACVSHAHARFREVGVPVVVGGVDIRPGDLVHGDRHGLQRIPAGVDLEELYRIASEIEARERELFAAADDGEGIDAFLSTWADVRARWPRAEGGTSAAPEAIA